MVKFIYERILIIKMGDKFVRIINSSEITNIVKDMCIEANIYLGNDVKNAIRAYEKEEESILGKNILNILMKIHIILTVLKNQMKVK